MALRYATIRCVMREVRLQDKPDALLAASPKGTVPVLLLPEQTLDESMAIVKWALAQNDPQGWCSEEPEVRVQMDQMIKTASTGLNRTLTLINTRQEVKV